MKLAGNLWPAMDGQKLLQAVSLGRGPLKLAGNLWPAMDGQELL